MRDLIHAMQNALTNEFKVMMHDLYNTERDDSIMARIYMCEFLFGLLQTAANMFINIHAMLKRLFSKPGGIH